MQGAGRATWVAAALAGTLAWTVNAGTAAAQESDLVRAGATELKGDILKEDFRELEIKTSAGSMKKAWKDVTAVVYKATPAAFAESEKLYRARQYTKAIDGYKSTVDDAGKGARDLFKQHAWYKLCMCYLMTRRYEDAITNFRGLLTFAPESKYLREIHTGIMRAYVDKGDGASAGPAIASAKNASKMTPLGDEFDAWVDFYTARQQEMTGKGPEALGSFTALAAAARSPLVQGEAAIAKGRVQMALGQTDGAEKSFRDALEKAVTANARAAAAGQLAELLIKKADGKDLPKLREAAWACALGIAVHYPEPGDASEGHERALFFAGQAYEALAAATPKSKDGRDIGAEEFKPKAAAAYRDLLDHYPDSFFADKARKRGVD
ncbi:MAG: hypothetical protein HZA54_10340 [Planctomycetes bacterium]|nr:hypothetical protein [Planctomycetota bacterium]